jgi:hypothetical protein
MQVLRLDHFAPRLNEAFTVEMDHGSTPFVLVEARPVGGPPVVGATREPFSLLFHNAAAVLFPQRTYTMRHDSMGEFGIFLVPVARNADGFIYQALFN